MEYTAPAQAVAFGMGGGLLQKVNRDTMQFATKLCHIVYADGSSRDIAKMPKTDIAKCSLPGVLGVKRVDGVPTAFPAHLVAAEDNLLKVVYDCGPVQVTSGRSAWNLNYLARTVCFKQITRMG